MSWQIYSHDNSRCIFLHKISTNGRCEPYYVWNTGKSICDGIYEPGVDYVYIPKRRLGGSQYLLRLFAELVSSVISSIPERCKAIANRLLCTHYYLPCGSNGTIHVPLPICPDVCRYMSETLCSEMWTFTAGFLVSDQIDSRFRYDEGIRLPSCDNTDEMIDNLNLSSDCCSDGGILLPQPSVTSITGIYTLSTLVIMVFTIKCIKKLLNFYILNYMHGFGTIIGSYLAACVPVLT